MAVEGRSDPTVFKKLEDLDSRTHGAWVEAVCASVEETTIDGQDGVKYYFEAVNDSLVTEETKELPLPETPNGSGIERFLDRLGYSLSTAKMPEGDRFWIHAKSGNVRKDVPEHLSDPVPTEAGDRKGFFNGLLKYWVPISLCVTVVFFAPITVPFSIDYLKREKLESRMGTRVYYYYWIIQTLGCTLLWWVWVWEIIL